MILPTVSNQAELLELKESLKSTNIELPEFKDYLLAENTGILSKVSAFQKENNLGELGGLIGHYMSLNQILPHLMTNPVDIVGG
jgi:hypothetical protein